jgi:DnaK suppressor protein
MLPSQLLFKFKTVFETEKSHLLEMHKRTLGSFEVAKDDMLDEVDWTASELENSMQMRLRNREVLYLKKLDEALSRIQAGTFGQCESCEEAIEVKRLEARPTTTKCVSCKESEERLETIHVDGHRSKSLGKGFRFIAS